MMLEDKKKALIKKLSKDPKVKNPEALAAWIGRRLRRKGMKGKNKSESLDQAREMIDRALDEQPLDEKVSARIAAESLIALGKGTDTGTNSKMVQEFLQFANKASIGAFIAFYQKLLK